MKNSSPTRSTDGNGAAPERKRREAEIARLLARAQEDAAELEARLASCSAELEEINAELDSFTYSVSHDLRAPLRAIQGFAEVLLEEEQADRSTRQSYLERIAAAAGNMDRLILALLSYSRLSRQHLVLKAVSLEQVVREATEELRLAEAGREYCLELAGPLPQVKGNHALLVQVLLNLLDNAVKFVPRGVTPQLRLWSERSGERVRLFLQDNGIGIAPEYQERIFKVFERLHGVESYPGTGIGLAIARKAVTRLGGQIGVESRPGEGSRFWIELPAG